MRFIAVLQTRTATRWVAALYCFTAIASLILGCFNVSNIYRDDVWILRGISVPWRASFFWSDLVRYGVLLLAPAAALLFAGTGLFLASAGRFRVFIIATALVMPFVLVTCLPHSYGGRAVLYVAGPIASILASIAYSKASYEKCAFWSSAALLTVEIFIIFWVFDSVVAPILGSYVLWGGVEFAIGGLISLSCLVSAIRLVHTFRTARLARKTFAA